MVYILGCWFICKRRLVRFSTDCSVPRNDVETRNRHACNNDETGSYKYPED